MSTTFQQLSISWLNFWYHNQKFPRRYHTFKIHYHITKINDDNNFTFSCGTTVVSSEQIQDCWAALYICPGIVGQRRLHCWVHKTYQVIIQLPFSLLVSLCLPFWQWVKGNVHLGQSLVTITCVVWEFMQITSNLHIPISKTWPYAIIDMLWSPKVCPRQFYFKPSLTRENTIFQNETPRSITYINGISQ